MFRKRKKKNKNRNNGSYNDLSLVCGYYNGSGKSSCKKIKKKKTIMGLSPGALELLCDSIPVRTDISIVKTTH